MYESLLSLVALVSTYLAPGFEQLPEKFELAVPGSSQVYAANGELMFEFGSNPEAQVSFAEIGVPLMNAVLAAEDKNFFSHSGFEPKALARASVYSLRSLAGGSTRLQGGSTITQQLAKVSYTDRRASFRRKVVEAYITTKLEQNFSKQEILTRYLNEVYLGRGNSGIANAAHFYFGKTPLELDELEAATIAAMIRAPESMLKDLARLDKTRHQVLALQKIEVDQKPLDLKGLSNDQIDLGLAKNKVPKRTLRRAFGYYEDQVMRDINDLFGEQRVAQGGLKIYTGYDDDAQLATNHAVAEVLTLSNAVAGRGKVKSYKVASALPAYNSFGLAAKISPIKAGWQATFDDVNGHTSCLIPNRVAVGGHQVKLKPYLKDLSSIRVMPIKPEVNTKVFRGFDLAQLKEVGVASLATNLCMPIIQSGLGAGATVLDPHTGAIKAIVGGADYHASEFNRASQARRQVGSLLKPFVFLRGLEDGLRLSQRVSMKAEKYDLGGGRFWQPRNANGVNSGVVSLERALLTSQNIPTVNLAESVGFANVFGDLKQLNVGKGLPRELAAVLGAGSGTVSDLAGDYAMFTNEEGSVPALTVSLVKDGKSKTVFNLEKQTCSLCREGSSFSKFVKRKQARDAYDVAAIRSIRGVLERVPTAGTAKQLGQPFAYKIFGKTGTTNAVRDAWFVGGTTGREEGELIVGAYLGYDQPQRIANYASAAKLAAPIFKGILANLDGFKESPILVASATEINESPRKAFERSFKSKLDARTFGYKNLSTLNPTFTYSAVLTGNVTMRRSPSGSGKYMRIINRGSKLTSVTCRRSWCKGTFGGQKGWFTKRWATLKPESIIASTFSYNRGHPVTTVAANFSSAVRTRNRPSSVQRVGTGVTQRTNQQPVRNSLFGQVFQPAYQQPSYQQPTYQQPSYQQPAGQTVTSKNGKKRRCKMVNLGGTMVEKCFNF